MAPKACFFGFAAAWTGAPADSRESAMVRAKAKVKVRARGAARKREAPFEDIPARMRVNIRLI